jgi:hypothetical protein
MICNLNLFVKYLNVDQKVLKISCNHRRFIKNAVVFIIILLNFIKFPYLTSPFIFLPHLVKPMFHFILQLNQVLPLHFSYSHFSKFLQCNFSSIQIDFLEFIIKKRTLILEIFNEVFLKFIVGIILSFHTFIFADVAPCRFYVWHCTFINGLYIGES